MLGLLGTVAEAADGAVLPRRRLQPGQYGKVYFKAAVSIGTAITFLSVL